MLGFLKDGAGGKMVKGREAQDGTNKPRNRDTIAGIGNCR
jgi:hypothetical protein